MKLNDVCLFCDDPDRGPKVHISRDKNDNLWPVTLKITSTDQPYSSPRITFFMTEAQLLTMIESFQRSFDSYVEERDAKDE